MEGLAKEVIVGELYCKKMVMSGPQYIISPHDPNVFLNEDSFFEYYQSGSGAYDPNQVCSLPMSISQDTFSFQFDFQDPIGIWLENPFMERYPLHSIRYIIHYVNGMSDVLILPILNDFVIQLWFLIFNAYILARL